MKRLWGCRRPEEKGRYFPVDPHFLVCFFLILTCMLGLFLPSQVAGKEGTITFVNLTDLHLSETLEDGLVLSRSADKILRELVVDLNQRRDLDFIVLTGDLVVNPDSGDLEVVREILDGLRKPYYVIPGNHDCFPIRKGTPQEGSKRLDVVFQGHGPQPGRMYWSHNPVRGLHLIGLDTTVPGTAEGRVDKEQLRWLAQDLETHAGERTIVLTHHNLTEFHPWDLEGEWKNYVLENGRTVRQLLEGFPTVCLVVSGHHHLCGIRTIQGIHYITCPSIASWPCRYSVFEIYKDTLTFSSQPIPSEAYIEKAWKNILGFPAIRKRFPGGKKGEEEIFNVFMGPQELVLPLRGR